MRNNLKPEYKTQALFRIEKLIPYPFLKVLKSPPNFFLTSTLAVRPRTKFLFSESLNILPFNLYKIINTRSKKSRWRQSENYKYK